MKSHTRLVVRTIQNVLIFQNPIIKYSIVLLKSLRYIFAFNRKSYNIQKSIYDNTKKLERTKRVLNKHKPRSSINFLR